MKLARYDVADLERLIREEVGSDDFAPRYLKSVATTLQRHPTHYRGFGPYWWPLKSLLIDAGYTQFGVEIEDDAALEALTYPTPALTVAAAYTFSEHSFAMGMHQSPAHTVDTDDGESTTYFIGDEELEGLLMARTLLAHRAGGTDGQA